MLVYLASPLDVGGEFAIGVVRIVRTREIIIIASRHFRTFQAVTVLSVLQIQRLRDNSSSIFKRFEAEDEEEVDECCSFVFVYIRNSNSRERRIRLFCLLLLEENKTGR